MLTPSALAVVASTANDLSSFSEELLDRAARSIGFDVAYHAIVGDPCRRAGASAPRVMAWRGFSGAARSRLLEHGVEYARELEPVKRAARGRWGVAVDSEVLAAGERARCRYFDEVMAPDGGRHAMLALGVVGGQVVSLTLFGRTGSAFSPRQVRAVERIAPVLGLASAARGAAATEPLPAPPPPTAAVGLSPRERDLVDYVALGLTNVQIGLAIGTSPRTVRNQLSLLYTRVGVASRAELVARLWPRDR